MTARAPGQVRGQLDALRLAAGERRRRLAQPQVTESDVVEDFQLAGDAVAVREEGHRLADGHVQNLVDVPAPVFDVEDRRLEPGAFALLANQLDVGQELHLDGDSPVALAHVAPPARNVEREMAGVVASRLGLARRGEGFADRVVDLDIGHRIRPRGAPDRRLVDEDYVIDEFAAVEMREISDLSLPIAALTLQPRVEAIMHERRFAGAGDAGDANKRAERDR